MTDLQILAHESFAQLRQIFEEYKNISGRTIEQAIKAEIDGELKDALSAIGQYLNSSVHTTHSSAVHLRDQECQIDNLDMVCVLSPGTIPHFHTEPLLFKIIKKAYVTPACQ